MGATTTPLLDYRESISNNIFPGRLKLADVSPLHKTGDDHEKTHYRSINLLPCVSKIYERLMFQQILVYMEIHLSDLLCGYRKGYNTQHALMRILSKLNKCLDKNGVAGAVLMDLSEAFDCLKHDLLIAKLAAYFY